MQLADRQNWSLSEAQQKVSSTELLLWKAYIERESNAFDPTHYYLAQIAQEVRRVLSKKPKSVKLEHFLLKFESKNSRPSAESVEARTNRSKLFWLGLVGMSGTVEKE